MHAVNARRDYRLMLRRCLAAISWHCGKMCRSSSVITTKEVQFQSQYGTSFLHISKSCLNIKLQATRSYYPYIWSISQNNFVTRRPKPSRWRGNPIIQVFDDWRGHDWIGRWSDTRGTERRNVTYRARATAPAASWLEHKLSEPCPWIRYAARVFEPCPRENTVYLRKKRSNPFLRAGK